MCQNKGMKKDDAVHLFVGNHIQSHVLAVASWSVGAVVSFGIGDGTLEAEIIADQVCAFSNLKIPKKDTKKNFKNYY